MHAALCFSFYGKVCCNPAQWHERALLFALYRPLTVHPTLSSMAAAGEKGACSSGAGSHQCKKTWPEAGRLEYAPRKFGSCAAACDKVRLAVNTLWGSPHSWRP